MRGSLPAELLGDLGASLGFSALALEVARTGEAFWVGLFAALGYFSLGPLLLLAPFLDRWGPGRALPYLRLLRGLLWLPYPFLPREAAPLVLLAYPLMVATDLSAVAWDALLARAGGRELLERTGRLYAAWNLGGLLGSLLGPPLLLVHPALPYLLAAGLLLSLLFTLAHALATALLGLLVLRAGTPEALFGLFSALADLGYTLGSYGAGRVPLALALLGGPALAALGLLAILLPFPFLFLGGAAYGLAVGAMGAHLRALRGWLLEREGLAQGLAAVRVLLYGAGAAGGRLAGALGRLDPTWLLRLGLLGFLAFYLFAVGPLHPKRLGALRREGA
ncbi:hypothetical protein TCCBUS3UF1_20640 [Thermus sp. CCB_US3_UF1]|uniref:hypothetical protein n=1 Tax=Thermus sp. CCB_US3_UF1 TaxID=1111069 RepID=UPI0002389254|nr:hypothetical protein [Thermus sp. CCB_US3_UF1]AEV17102.1 hypothetical protein TCCBUS3UF1_20640 [Thermus sp. CCB_US3_UF1]